MSSLWTPSGEHPVDRSSETGGAGAAGPPEGQAPADLSDLSPEEREQLEAMSRQVEEARRQLIEAPAGPVVGQQALQFYELAALHLSQPEPKLGEARIAIDAFAAVVERLGSRLGEAEDPLRQALNQVQLAFVEVSRRTGGASGDAGEADDAGAAGSAGGTGA